MQVYGETTTINPIFQTTHKNSKRYQQIESTDLVDYFQTRGFIHQTTSFATPRCESKQGFQKHVMIFEHPDLIIDDENRLQLLVTNSHDGSSSIVFNIGIFRTVCANGLVVGTNFFEERLRHVGHNFYLELENIKDKIIARAPYILQTIKDMQETELTRMQVIVLAEEVAKKRFEKTKGVTEVNLRKLIEPKRLEDTKRDLYTIYNLLQEKVIKGGIQYAKQVPEFNENGDVIKVTIKKNTTREVTAIDSKRKLNQMVFDSAVKLLEVA